ncbi:ABC transporter permease [Mesobacillus maritimus]|uniref:ABC transporter permease subunit n=1 Tax=Mesobacillus maritimus TaxID=1643336 RepID=UPI00203CD9D5|nr:ABC transporter permease subunit [Mesobacillus maritimus]MCM3670397.1 ABC transporter permease [Mesobacillus maritimus]
MNIVKREMKANAKALIFWCIGVLVMVGAGMGKYAGMNGNGDTINELMSEMPASLQAIMGTASFDLSTAVGFYGLLYVYLIVMATIHAVMLGSNMIAKEERDKTAEFLLVKPISRSTVISMKMVSALVQLLVFNLVTLVSSIIIVERYAGVDETTGTIYLLMIGMFLLQVLFLIMGTAIAVFSNNATKASAVATAILLLLFILSILINLSGNPDLLKYVTPFKYFEAESIINHHQLEPFYVSLTGILIIALTTISYIYYQKKDLNL